MRSADRPVEYLIASSAETLTALQPLGGPDTVLSPDEMSAAQRFRKATDRADYRAGHAIFRLMAARWLGIGHRETARLPVTRYCRSCGDVGHGKPQIDGVELSQSRSAGQVMIAASPPGRSIGADLERLPVSVYSGFDDYVLSSTERETVTDGDVGARIRYWVAKEAALKLTGHGLSVDTNHISVAPRSDPRPARSLCTPWKSAVVCPSIPEINGIRVASIGAPRGYVAALAHMQTPNLRRLHVADIVALGTAVSVDEAVCTEPRISLPPPARVAPSPFAMHRWSRRQ